MVVPAVPEMFTHIMVPLDGSELAERALPAAEHLSAALGAMLHLVQVVEPPAHAAAHVHSPDMRVAESRAPQSGVPAYLEAWRARLASTGLPVQATHLYGNAPAVLVDYERSVPIDLVVLCSHGRTGLARLALGSVAEHLLRHGAAPVLLVRAFGPLADLGQAVVALDGSAEAEIALRLIGPLARRVVQEVTLLRAVGTVEQGLEAECYLQGAARRLQRQGFPLGGEAGCQRRVERGDPAQVIIDVARTGRLVVMATHARAGVARWALGSVADQVVRAGVAAVLLVRREQHPGPAAP